MGFITYEKGDSELINLIYYLINNDAKYRYFANTEDSLLNSQTLKWTYTTKDLGYVAKEPYPSSTNISPVATFSKSSSAMRQISFSSNFRPTDSASLAMIGNSVPK